MKLSSVLFFLLLALAACRRETIPQAASKPPASAPSPTPAVNLLEARNGFVTQLTRHENTAFPVPDPPAELFRLAYYETPAGKLAAYVSQPPPDRKKHPAIIWIVGGFSNSISEVAWEPAPASNDQSAAAFRKAGVLMMYPSLRGGNDNPGFHEGFYGEVDDVLSAAKYLASLDYVDPTRIYLGGHSTGGTLALLIAECPNSFRAVFSFGPVTNVAAYGAEVLPFDITNKHEVELRSPGLWLPSIQHPVFVFEGINQPSNIKSLEIFTRINQNPLLHFYPVNGADHRSILAPVTALIASKIVADDGPELKISFTEKELNDLFKK